MTEGLAELDCRKGVVTVLVILDDKVKESLDVFLVNETTFHAFWHIGEIALLVARPDTEELREVESAVLDVLEPVQDLTEVEGEDIQLRQSGIGIRVTKVIEVPFRLRLLFHDVVPGEDLVLLIVVEKVEWCSGEVQDVGVSLVQEGDDVLTEVGPRALVGLVDNDQVKLRIEYLGVLFEFSSGLFRPAKILD